MSTQADVKSIDTLAYVKAALASYAHETGQAIAEVELEGRRAVDYITVDRAAYSLETGTAATGCHPPFVGPRRHPSGAP